MKVKIIGGMSGKGRISIISDKFVSVGVCDSEGNVSCKVRALPVISNKIFEKSYIPKIIRMAAFAIILMSWRTRLFMIVYMGMVTFLKISASEQVHAPVTLWPVLLVVSISGTILTSAAYFFRVFIAPWHGAEHMVISSYERKKKVVPLSEIRKESPISEKCGVRFFFPLMICHFFSSYVEKRYGISYFVPYLLIFECILLIDSFVGWDKIPITSQASRLLQRYVTTSFPKDVELLTAQKAMCGLIEAHK